MDRRGALTFLLRRVLPVLAVAALLVASLKLAEDAAGDNARFAAHYRWVLGAAAAALGLLVVTIGQRLWRLHTDVARAAPGARLNRRLLRLLIVLALPSTVVVYAFALRFLDATIDNWFNVRLEQAPDDALREVEQIASGLALEHDLPHQDVQRNRDDDKGIQIGVSDLSERDHAWIKTYSQHVAQRAADQK